VTLPSRRVLPASAAPDAPGYRVESPWPGVVLGLTAGDDVDMRSKRAPNEDSLAALRFEHSRIGIVGDAHFGPASSELAVDLLARSLKVAPADEHALLAVVEAAALRVEKDELTIGRSETTLLTVMLEGRTLRWVSVGDSLLFAVQASGAMRLLSRPAAVYVGRPGVAAALPFDAGVVELAEGEWALLATDGIEPDSSGMDLSEVGACLRGAVDAEAGVAELLARAGAADEGGGGDNLAVVVLHP